MVSQGEARDRGRPADDPGVEPPSDAGVEPPHLVLGQVLQLVVGEVEEGGLERPAEERRRLRDPVAEPGGKEGRRVEDAQRPVPLAAREQDAEPLRRVLGARRRPGLEDDGEPRVLELREARGAPAEAVAEEPDEARGVERREDPVGLDHAAGAGHDAPRARGDGGGKRSLDRGDRARDGDLGPHLAEDALERGGESLEAAPEAERPGALPFLRLQEAPDDASAPSLRVPQRGESAPDREGPRVVGVDPRGDRFRRVAGHFGSETPLEEAVDRLVLEARRAGGDEGLRERPELGHRGDGRGEETRRSRDDRAGDSLADDPARRPRVGGERLALQAEVGEEPLGGGRRAKGVRPRLHHEVLLQGRLDRAPRLRARLEEDRLASVRLPAAAEGGGEARDPRSEDHDPAHGLFVAPADASVRRVSSARPRTKSGWSFSPSAAT